MYLDTSESRLQYSELFRENESPALCRTPSGYPLVIITTQIKYIQRQTKKENSEQTLIFQVTG